MKSVKVLLKFAVGEATKPITWEFATVYGLHFTILQADVQPDQGGRLIMDLSGEEENIERAIAYAKEENVSVTVLSKSVQWDNTLCVHCGACTAVCPSRALSIDPVTAELCFKNELCVVCERCTYACPTGALSVALFA